MKNKLWKKINNRIRIIESDKGFVVEIKDSYRNWHKLRDAKIIQDALHQKHSYTRKMLYKDLGVGIKYKKKRYAK